MAWSHGDYGHVRHHVEKTKDAFSSLARNEKDKKCPGEQMSKELSFFIYKEGSRIGERITIELISA